MRSPIQLISRKFMDIELHPQAQDADVCGFSLSHMIVIEQDDDAPSMWRATVGARLQDKAEDEPAPYIGEVRVAGHFKLDPKFPEDKAEDMVYLNAGAILYGIIRELVLSLTSQSINGELILPAVDARTFLPKRKEEEEKKENSSENIS